jgi:beta-aspartyl-peptidase (threonine type)
MKTVSKYAIAIHGGAGTIPKNSMSDEKRKQYEEGLAAAIIAAENILKEGGSAIDAVEKAVMSLEDFPLFNAGKGAVFTHDKTHEMDASIMDGSDLNAGAVAGVAGVKNPIRLARVIKDYSGHVFLAGKQAEDFAHYMKLEFEPEEYFYTEERYKQLIEIIDTESYTLDHRKENNERKFGTVGAVALDQHGNMAAATSTGGMTNKRYGRIGDTPVIGAGTYANNNTCAISCTGHGEYFLRAVVAHDISCLMEYKNLNLKQACEEVVKNKLVKLGGEGGLIAVDKHGNIELCFNSEGMYRASKKQNEDIHIKIYAD